MKCELEYCIYNENYKCLLEEIQINSLGMCEDCIMVSIKDEKLKILKKNQLKDMENKGDQRK